MTDDSLYERLGGVFAIAAVVDHFSDAIVKNPIVGQGVAARPVDLWRRSGDPETAEHRPPLDGQREADRYAHPPRLVLPHASAEPVHLGANTPRRGDEDLAAAVERLDMEVRARPIERCAPRCGGS